MPGKSKKGGGLESSPVYKKSPAKFGSLFGGLTKKMHPPFSPFAKKKFGTAKSPFNLRSGNNIGGRNGNGVNFKAMGSPARLKGFFVTDEFGEDKQVSKEDYYKADKAKRYSTGRAKMTEMNEKYEAMKNRAIDRGADKRELADLKEAHMSGKFEEYQDAFDYSQTEEGKAEYKKQKELGI